MPTNKYFACPFCKERFTREDMVVHISRKHYEELPSGFTPLRATFHAVNRKDFKYNRPCRICKKPTPWNEPKGRYDFLCTNPSCKKAWIENMKNTMGDKYGAFRPTTSPEGLEKMLAARKISGVYKFTSGGEVPYTGSYEKKCLEFMDKVLDVKIEDVQVPGPVIRYPYKGQTHIYIPDIYYRPYNLIIEVKDGGSNPNKHPGYSEVRAKKLAKENYVIKHTDYNYLRQTDNDFSQLLGVFADLKLHLNNDDKSRVTHVHETSLGEHMGIAAMNPIVGFIPGKDVVIANNTKRQTFGVANSPKFEKIVTLNHLNQVGFDKAENFGSKEDVKLYVKKDIYPKIEKDIEKFMDKEMTEQTFYEMIFGHPMYTKDQILFEDVIDYSKFLDNMEVFTIEATLDAIFGKDDEVICEGFDEFKSTFLNEEDVKYNYDAFSRGTSDILFVTGPESFGKAKDFTGIGEQFGADIIHLDDVQKHYLYSDKKLKEKHKLIYKYFTETDKGIEYRKKKKKDIEVNLYEIVPNFILYFLNNREKDKRYIVEGTQLIDLLAADRLDINLLKDYSILLKGSSYLQTKIQTMRSDMNTDSEKDAFNLLTGYIDAISKEVKKTTHDNFSNSLKKKDNDDRTVEDVIKDAFKESVDKSVIDNDHSTHKISGIKYIDANSPEGLKYLKKYENEKLYSNMKEYWIDKKKASAILAIDTKKELLAGYICVKSNGDIQPVYVYPDYRGSGISTELCKQAIDKLGANKLGVYSDNQIAIHLYDSLGFKEYDKKKYKDGSEVIKMKLDESTLLENNLFNSKDIYYNKDKFDSGEINLCFITGHGGSGKSTMGKGMNADHYELDDVTQNWNFSDQDLKKYGNLIYQFFNTAGKKFRYRSEEDMEAGNNPLDDTGDNYDKELVTAFVNYAKSYAKSHPYEKIVIEGIQLFLFIPPESIKDYAVYIKGTSKLVSAFRAANRDTTNDGLKGFDKVKSMVQAMTNKKTNKYRDEDERMINKYRQFFKECTEVDMSILESSDVYYNLDDWCRENNILYVTGLTGSGKTYLANKLFESTNSELVSLDNISFHYMNSHSSNTMQNKINNTLLEQCPEALEFFDLKPMEKYGYKEKYRDTIDIQKEFCNWFINKYQNTSKKYILEGDLLFNIHPGEWYNDKPIIIKNNRYDDICRRRAKRMVVGEHSCEVIEECAQQQMKNRLLRDNYNFITKNIESLSEAVESRLHPDDIFYCIEDDTIDLTGDLEDYPILEVSEEDLKKNMELSPVFVMLSFNGGIVGKVIKGYGKDLGWEYSHSSISLVPSLSTLYSFNITKTTDDEGKKHKYNGLAIEHFRDFRDNPKCKIKVIAILVDIETKKKIRDAIQYYIDNIDKTKYATTSLAKALFGTGEKVQNYGNMTLFCSQFVDSVLKQANIDIGGRGSSVNTHPSELGQFKDKNNYFTVYEGKASEYNEDKVNEKILYMKQTMTHKELNAITDKSSTVDKDDHTVENRAKQYIDRKIEKFKNRTTKPKPEPLDRPLAVQGG